MKRCPRCNATERDDAFVRKDGVLICRFCGTPHPVDFTER